MQSFWSTKVFLKRLHKIQRKISYILLQLKVKVTFCVSFIININAKTYFSSFRSLTIGPFLLDVAQILTNETSISTPTFAVCNGFKQFGFSSLQTRSWQHQGHAKNSLVLVTTFNMKKKTVLSFNVLFFYIKKHI